MSVGLISLLFGVAAFLAVYAVLAPVNDLAAEEAIEDPFGEPAPAPATADGLFDRVVRPALRNFLPQTPMAAMLKARGSDKITELLVRSGNPWNIRPEEYLGIRILGAFAGCFAALVLGLLEALPAEAPLAVWLALGAGVGAYLPKVRLDAAKGARRKAAQKGLPEALDLLVITLGSGQNFQPALAEVVARLPEGLIRQELTRVSSDLRAGKSLQRSLTDFARRAPSEEVESFCKAVAQAEALGADVSTTLKAQAASARQSYEAALDVRTGKLPTTLYFPILGLMLPALFIVILAPALSSINEVL